jgi:hypothetical protein
MPQRITRILETKKEIVLEVRIILNTEKEVSFVNDKLTVLSKKL